jgi:hypothetical protein
MGQLDGGTNELLLDIVSSLIGSDIGEREKEEEIKQ